LSAVDYQNATDGIHPELSAHYVDHVSLKTGMGMFEIDAFRKSMSGHQMHYPDKTQVMQVWGQLMGSPSSFPALCIINFAILWVSAEEYFDCRLEYVDVDSIFTPLFNGDDGLFRSNQRLQAIWERVARSAGLTPSVGKSYCHERLAMINSEIFVPTGEIDGKYYSFKKVFSLNPGLIKGQGRVLSDTRSVVGEDRPSWWRSKMMPICDQLSSCLHGCDDEQKIIIQELFFYHNKDRLIHSNRSWVLPRALGGLGLPRGTSTFSQKCVAQCILEGKDIGDFNEAREKPDYLVRAQIHEREILNELRVEKIPPKIVLKNSDLGEDQKFLEYQHSDIISYEDIESGIDSELFDDLNFSSLHLGHIPDSNKCNLEICELSRFSRVLKKSLSLVGDHEVSFGEAVHLCNAPDRYIILDGGFSSPFLRY